MEMKKESTSIEDKIEELTVFIKQLNYPIDQIDAKEIAVSYKKEVALVSNS